MAARILVIEDNADNLELMTYLLKAFGHTVFEARDGAEGLNAVKRELPDLVLCDLQMPKVDGYEVAKAVRRDPVLAKLPLVAVTAYAMRGDRDRVLAAGFDGYISKPIVPEEFVGQVERFLEANQPSPAQPAPAAEERHQGPAACRATIVVVDNCLANLDLIRSTLEPFGYRVITAETVREGLEIARESLPDLILSDLHMRDADGYAFLKIVKADPGLREIPFAIISSTVWRETDPSLALSMGADRFILRPIEPGEFLAQIEACVGPTKKSSRST